MKENKTEKMIIGFIVTLVVVGVVITYKIIY